MKITIQQAAKLLGVSRQYIHQLIQKGKFKTAKKVKLGGYVVWVIEEEEVKRRLKNVVYKQY